MEWGDRCLLVTGLPVDELTRIGTDQAVVEELVWREDGVGGFVIFKKKSVADTFLRRNKEKMEVGRPSSPQLQECAVLRVNDTIVNALEESFRELTPSRKAKVRSRLDTTNLSPPASVLSSSSPVPQVTSQHMAMGWQEQPRICCFSGEPGKESPFERWRFEVESMQREGFGQGTVMAAVRRSLKSPAADVFRRMGGTTEVGDVVERLRILYGRVVVGGDILKKFYGEKQAAGENCANWAIRLEDYVHQAEEEGQGSAALREALPGRFWDGLKDERVRNALRHQKLSLEGMIVESRKVEMEGTQIEVAKVCTASCKLLH